MKLYKQMLEVIYNKYFLMIKTISIFIYFLFSTAILSAQAKFILNGKVSLDSCIDNYCNSDVSIYKNGLLLKKLVTDKKGNFVINLDFNNFYLLLFTKEYYITKEIIIDTSIPEGLIGDGFEWPFKLGLLKMNEKNLIKDLKMSFFKFRYFPNKDSFDYDSLYYEPLKNLIFKSQFATFKNHTGMYKYGDNALLHHIFKNCFYPEELKDSAIIGTVVLEVDINKFGHIDTLITLNSVHPLFEKEAKRVISMTNGNWTSIIENDTAINYKIILPIEFTKKCDKCKTSMDYYNAGVKQFKNENFLNAIEFFSLSLKINPLDFEALYNKAVCFIRLKDYVNACKDLNKLQQFGRKEANELIDKVCK